MAIFNQKLTWLIDVAKLNYNFQKALLKCTGMKNSNNEKVLIINNMILKV